ncbi:unnamed protein product [Pieris macdunnoughi]|uniref:Uncharacterized protein n=1 Tax=Pieris macdunnoughi TaxID=345717 RepID=A0A821QWF3_9NEOP|nr:unnamed protein product [Pieris macdunnoughi]
MERKSRRDVCGPRAKERSRSRGGAAPPPPSSNISAASPMADRSRSGSRSRSDRAPGPGAEDSGFKSDLSKQLSSRYTAGVYPVAAVPHNPSPAEEITIDYHMLRTDPEVTGVVINVCDSDNEERSSASGSDLRSQLSSRHADDESALVATPHRPQMHQISQSLVSTDLHTYQSDNPAHGRDPEELLAYLEGDLRPSQPISARAGYEMDALFVAQTLIGRYATDGLARAMCEYLAQTRRRLLEQGILTSPLSSDEHNTLAEARRAHNYSLRRPPPPDSDEDAAGTAPKRVCAQTTPPNINTQHNINIQDTIPQPQAPRRRRLADAPMGMTPTMAPPTPLHVSALTTPQDTAALNIAMIASPMSMAPTTVPLAPPHVTAQTKPQDTADSNIAITNINLRRAVEAPRYVRNATIARDLRMESIDEFVARLTKGIASVGLPRGHRGSHPAELDREPRSCPKSTIKTPGPRRQYSLAPNHRI